MPQRPGTPCDPPTLLLKVSSSSGLSWQGCFPDDAPFPQQPLPRPPPAAGKSQASLTNHLRIQWKMSDFPARSNVLEGWTSWSVWLISFFKNWPLICRSVPAFIIIIELHFTYHTIHLLYLHNSMIFCIFTELCNYHRGVWDGEVWKKHTSSGILVPQLGINPCPLHWKCRVLTTILPGKSQFHSSLCFHCPENLGKSEHSLWTGFLSQGLGISEGARVSSKVSKK